jgi:hypothetical protein
MNPTSHETWPTRFRKRIKAINTLVAIPAPGEVIFRPVPGTQYVLESAYVRVRNIDGAVTDAPNISLTDGTTATVAGVDLLTVEKKVQRLAVVGDVVIDYDHPLSLVVSDAGAAAGAMTHDLILFVDKISE